MRPIRPRLGLSPLSRAERKGLVILFLFVRPRRGSPGIADHEAELLEAGVDPSWSLPEFDAWVEEGE